MVFVWNGLPADRDHRRDLEQDIAEAQREAECRKAQTRERAVQNAVHEIAQGDVPRLEPGIALDIHTTRAAREHICVG